ncbi:MAG: TerB family tellurite resistance protein [Candidatus Puniceispirillum sp.]
MSIWGIIIGGTAGFAMGGPIGALLGAAAGHAVEKRLTPQPDSDATKQVAFTVAVIALSAKMAKADGMVTRDEIGAFRNRVHIPASEVKQVGKFWDLARKTPDGFQDYAHQVARLFAPRTPVLEQLLDLLFYIARSDGAITQPEQAYLAEVAHIFGFTDDDFARFAAIHGGDGPSAYEVLAVTKDISDADLKTQWKKLVRSHHPDKLMADGMPEEFIEAANERLAAINAAYDAICRQRGIS